MAKDPAILFYTSDFLSGCIDLTMEERGQYITLLCIQHQKGELTEKTIRLSVGSASVSVLDKFERLENGNYVNKRMAEEAEKRRNYLESRRLNGTKGGRPKKPYAKPYDKPTNNHTENENENENNSIIKVSEFCKKFVNDESYLLSFTTPPPKYIKSLLTNTGAGAPFEKHCIQVGEDHKTVGDHKSHLTNLARKRWAAMSMETKRRYI